MFALVNFHARNLGVPARRDVDDQEVLRGKTLFYGAGCTGCHRPKFVTRRDTVEPEQTFQQIWPYPDLLRPTMGQRRHASRPRGEELGEATGRERGGQTRTI